MHAVDTVLNCIVIVGLVLVPFTWMRYLVARRSVFRLGVAVYTTTALSQMLFVTGRAGTGLAVEVHLAQAVAIVWFIVSFFILLSQAERLLRAAEARAHQAQTRDELTDPDVRP